MFNVGIIGCGHIAEKMAATLNSMERASLYAAAARDGDRAAAFASKYGAARHYGSYEELCMDPDVDLVYIATPMSEHKKNMLLAISHKKAVLCEKSFTVSRKEAEEVLREAKKSNIYVAEAIWTRYMPAREIINEIIRSGRIGEVTTVSANLSYNVIGKERVSDPKLGGGALLDIGVYAINFALMAEEGKKLKSITGSAVKNKEGADLKNSIILCFDDGAQAVLFSDATTCSDRKGMIYCTDGYIEVENINNPEKVSVYSGGRNPVLIEEYPITHRINGFEYQVEAAIDAIDKGHTEPAAMPHSETLRVMGIMDALRGIWDVRLGSEI